MAQQGPKSMGDMVGGGRPDHGRAYEVQRASEERTFVEFRDGTSVELITAKVLPAEPRTFTGSDRVAGPQAISRRGQGSPVYDRGNAGPFGPQSMDAIFDAQFASVEAAKAQKAGAVGKGLAQAQQMSEAAQQEQGSRELD